MIGPPRLNTQLNTDLTWIENYQHPSGGVAYLPGRKPRIEPTTYAILAGLTRPEDIIWLRAVLPQQIFNNPLPPISRIKSPYHIDGRPWIVAAGILALCQEQTLQDDLDLAACAKYFQENHAADSKGQTKNMMEVELVGALPWNYGNYGWVQPTCWGIFTELALLSIATKQSDQELLLSNLQARLDYILSRKTADQGWNYGNTILFDVEIPAHPLETAMALAALGGIKNSKIASYLIFTKINPDPCFATLDQLITNEGSRLTKAWLKIARRCWKKNTDSPVDIPQNRPAIGESSVDCLIAHIATIQGQQQGFHFLYPKSKP